MAEWSEDNDTKRKLALAILKCSASESDDFDFTQQLAKTRLHILADATNKFNACRSAIEPISEADPDGWTGEAKAALLVFKQKVADAGKERRRLISTGAPPVDTSLPTADSTLVPPPQGSGLWMLALSILPLLVILYFIRRFYKSFKAPRRDSDDFVNLEMLLVVPKDL